MAFPVGPQPMPVAVNGGVLKNEGSVTVYYRDELPVSSTTNDGSIVAGASARLDGTQWVATATAAGALNVFTGGSDYLVVDRWAGQAPAAQTVGTRVLRPNGAPVSSVTGGANGIVSIAASMWPPPPGKTAKLLLRIGADTNDAAPACTWTFALVPITAVSGGSGTSAVTLGTPIAASTVTFALQAANTHTVADSGDFNLPADGPYVVTMINDVQSAAGADYSVIVTLLRRWV